jgi:hypothetical protein
MRCLSKLFFDPAAYALDEKRDEVMSKEYLKTALKLAE